MNEIPTVPIHYLAKPQPQQHFYQHSISYKQIFVCVERIDTDSFSAFGKIEVLWKYLHKKPLQKRNVNAR